MLDEIVIYCALITVVTVILSASPILVWAYLVLFATLCIARLNKTFDSGMAKWFTVAKFIGALAGVLSLTWIRQSGGTMSPSSHLLVAALLAVNILEAFARDAQSNNWANAATAVYLIATIPYSHKPQPETPLPGWFSFELEAGWILLYSSWNAAFSYANNFAWTTRLILLPPLLLCPIVGLRYWLGARATSLLAHLTMRAVHLTPFYTPGETSLTPVVDTVTHDATLAKSWSTLNAVASLCVVFMRSDLTELNHRQSGN
jgi:hypothetical protein